MFEVSLLDPADLEGCDDAALVAAMQDCARVAAAADARRLAAIAVLAGRNAADPEDEQSKWACDDWDATAAEISCALNCGHGRASAEMDLAVSLRDRFPKLGAKFLAGAVSLFTVKTIVNKTALVDDEAALASLDAELAKCATGWSALSKFKLEQAIDILVQQVDPDAVRRSRNSNRGRYITIGDPDDAAGTTSIFGRLCTTDAALLDCQLTRMAKGVCEDDPRTLAQRRADALGALGAGSTHLACRCDNPDCRAGVDDGRASSVLVHVVAEQSTLSQPTDALQDGFGLAPHTPPADDPPTPPRRKAALISGAGGGIVSPEQLADLIAHGAKVRNVKTPAGEPEKHYRPSRSLDEFVRTRDLTCRFPGCDRPAARADIDHTVPWPAGATHASDLVCLCRKHHLLKTFWAGWAHCQLPDGTLEVTTPSGHTYRTQPLSSTLFPGWDTTTPAPPAKPRPEQPPGSTQRHLKMPLRSTTRAKARQYRHNAERAQNALENTLREFGRPPPDY